MNQEPENPYASPQLDTAATGDPAQSAENVLHGLKKRSVILMIILTMLTMGLYINYWIHRLAVDLNRKVEARHRIAMGLVVGFWALSLASVLWTIPEVLSDEDSIHVDISGLLTNADMIFTLVFAFIVRSRLNVLMRASPGQPTWCHGFWTFMFGIYYLQWKINRGLRMPQLPLNPVAAPAPAPVVVKSDNDGTNDV